MGLINRSIPNLYNGVSQQPASLRLASQAELQENAVSSVVDGLKKRPPTEHIAKVRTDNIESAFVHTINRDSTHQYVLVVTNGDLAVYDLQGNQKTVSFPDGKGYLAAATPRSSFVSLTVADYTFIVNKTITVAKGVSTASGTLKGSKQKFVDLPVSGVVVGDVWEIAGDNSNNFDNFYVIADASNVWRECLKPGLLNSIDAATMPWTLIDNLDGTFTFKKATWTNRVVGDEDSNPFSSFVTGKINDIFFHRNRLGFVSDENVVFSRAGDFFNFFRASVTAVLDNDPVDVSVASTKVSTLKHGISFNTSLLLFADQTQFQLSAKDLLTPKTVNINATTEYEVDNQAKPVAAGTSLFFVTPKGSYSGLKEYTIQPLTYTNEAADITAHVPSYIPQGVFKLAASTIDDYLYAISLTERNALYVYRYYWGDEKTKIQSAWSKWVLDAGDVILNCDVIGTKLFLLIQRSDGVYLEQVDTQIGRLDTGLGFLVLLDRRKALTGSYNSGTNLTTWTLPYADSSALQVVLGATFAGREGEALTTSRPTSSTITAVGNYSGGSCFVGRKYTMRYRLSEIHIRDEQKITTQHYQIKLKNIIFNYDNTSYFIVEVTPHNRETYTTVFNAKTVGDASLVIGAIPVASGKLRVPVFTDTKGLSIDLTNDSYMPCALQGAEWEALISTQSKHF